MTDKNYKSLLKPIRNFVFDMDGVITDGSVVIDAEGIRLRNMNMKDSFAIQHAVSKSYGVAIISRGKGYLRNFFHDIGVKDVYLGVSDKLETLKDHLNSSDRKPEQTLYMGDDFPDVQCIQYAGLGCCPQDAAPEVKAISNYVSHIRGGHGCVREVIRQVMTLHGNWV